MIGVDSTMPVITYCQSGVRSAHTTFVLTQLLGFKNVRNYDGSWIEWSQHNALALETGPVPPLLPIDDLKWYDLWYWWVLLGALLASLMLLRRLRIRRQLG